VKCLVILTLCDTFAANVWNHMSNQSQRSQSESASCSTYPTSLIISSLNIECDIFSPQLLDCPIYLSKQMFEMPVHGDASPHILVCALTSFIMLHGFRYLFSSLHFIWLDEVLSLATVILIILLMWTCIFHIIIISSLFITQQSVSNVSNTTSEDVVNQNTVERSELLLALWTFAESQEYF